MDEALQNDCVGYPRCRINQKGAKQFVVRVTLVVAAYRWLTFQPLPSCPDRRTVSFKNSALESHEICVCVCFQSLPYEVPMHRPGKITQHLACLQGSHMILNLSRFKCAKLGTKMLLSWRITDNTEHDLWRYIEGRRVAGANSLSSWWVLGLPPISTHYQAPQQFPNAVSFPGFSHMRKACNGLIINFYFPNVSM